MKLPIGISDFKQLTTKDYTFVDKTLFIKEVLDDGAGVILITRHRRFVNTFTAILNEKANLENIRIAIKQLSKYLMRKFGKPAIILIDEYDTPIQEAYIEGYYVEMIKLMRGILGEALKDNPYLAKAVLTGI